MARVRSNFVSGLVGSALASGTTSLSSPGLASLPAVVAPDVAAITLDPDAVGGDPEIVHVTAHTAAATTATIARGREGSSARAHGAGIGWVHGPTAEDIDGTAEASYAAALSGTGTAIGNGTITGRYYQLGKLVFFAVQINVGSTTVFATSGETKVTLPVTPDASINTGEQMGELRYFDASAPLTMIGQWFINGGTAALYAVDFAAANNTALQPISDTFPIATTSGDFIRLSGFYVAA